MQIGLPPTVAENPRPGTMKTEAPPPYAPGMSGIATTCSSTLLTPAIFSAAT